MEKKIDNLSLLAYINWTARILTVLFAAFLSIFSFDAFSENYSFWENIFSLFMHLIPVIVILLVLAVSWNRPLAGVIFYALFGVLYIFWAWGRFPLSVYFMISGPLFIMSVLYFIIWRRYQKK